MADDAEKPAADAEAKLSEIKTYSDEYVKELIAERDKAKEKARKFDEEKRKAEEAKAIEEGRLKEVLAEKERKLAELEQLQTQVAEERKARRESLIKKLPQDMIEFAPDDLAKLEKFVEKNSTAQPAPSSEERWKPGAGKERPKFRNAQEMYAWLEKNGLKA